MATLNFKLRDEKAKEETTINYYISLGRGSRLRGATPYFIKPKYWNHDNQEIRNISDVYRKRTTINNETSVA